MPKKKYSSGVDYEAKLKTVMERLCIDKFNYDWTRRDCFVELTYHGKVCRFENSFDKAASSGRQISYVSDLFAEIVLSLEGLARATEKNIFTLDMLFAGVPSLPAARALPNCFALLGISEIPDTEEKLKARYYELAKIFHPDVNDGETEAFEAIHSAYEKCLDYLRREENSK